MIEITELKEVVKDSTKFNPVSKWMNKEHSFYDSETVTFLDYWYVKIEDNCKLIKMAPNSDISNGRKYKNASLKLLRQNEISNMSNIELRLMRNEIFADYGYKFKSKDLDEYFRKQSWYNPRYEDVTTNLTELEKVNIEVILRQEKKNKSN